MRKLYRMLVLVVVVAALAAVAPQLSGGCQPVAGHSNPC